jgi:hypothetical protein
MADLRGERLDLARNLTSHAGGDLLAVDDLG